MRRRTIMCLLTVLACAMAEAQVVITSSGFATSPGPALQNATPTVTVPTTPAITFVNRSSSPVGATNSTGGNVAGASNATIGNVPGISNASIGVPVYATTQYTPNANLIAEEQAGAPTLSSLTAGSGGVYNVGPGTAQTFNFGVAETASAYGPAGAGPSLARVAAETRYRAQHAQNVRVYTNADLQRLPETGITTASITPAPAGAEANAGGVAGAATASSGAGTPAERPTGIAVPPSPFAPKASGGASAAPVATEQPAPSPAPEGATPPSGRPETAHPLPPTGSSLPLLAVSGMAALAAGLLARRQSRSKKRASGMGA
jgi:hypothetical protein